MQKKIAAALALGVALTVVITACSSGSSKSGGSSTPDKNEPRIKLSFFHSNAGITVPPTLDLSNNPILNIVKDKANVDLSVEMPPYADFPTKYNLLLSSGSLPDVVHTYLPDPTYTAARQGAFIDLKKYYDNSPIIKKVITPQMMELAKDPVSGKYWRIPMAYDKGPQGSGIYARKDLVDKYNAGKWPTSVDEWVDLLRKIKKAEPDSIPMSTRIKGDQEFSYGGEVLFDLYGANPYGYRIQNGKVIPNVDLPEFKAAVDLYRQLYNEGVFDPQFATDAQDKWFTKWDTKDVLFQWNSADQMLPNQAALTAPGTPADKAAQRFAFAPDLTKYPSVLASPKYVTGFQGLPISAHGLYISASSKTPDRDWRLIEAFASDELKNAIFWGKEGETYNMKDGKKVPIVDKLGSPDRSYAKMYAFIFGYTDGQDAQQSLYEAQMGTPTFNVVKDSMKQRQSDAEANGIGTLVGYVESDDVVKKNSEMTQAINKFTTEAIMGKISMDQLSVAIADWDKQYRTLKYDPMQKYLDANKANLKSLGVKMVDW